MLQCRSASRFLEHSNPTPPGGEPLSSGKNLYHGRTGPTDSLQTGVGRGSGGVNYPLPREGI